MNTSLTNEPIVGTCVNLIVLMKVSSDIRRGVDMMYVC